MYNDKTHFGVEMGFGVFNSEFDSKMVVLSCGILQAIANLVQQLFSKG